MNSIPTVGVSALFYFSLWFLGAWLWCVAWRSSQVDSLRQKLFALRDDLFDYAMRNPDQLRFSDPAYCNLRSTINTMIRFAHMVNASRLILPLLRRHSPETRLTHYERWRTAVDRLGADEAKKQLNAFERRMGILLSKHMISTSPAAVPIFLLLAIRSRGVVNAGTPQAVVDEGAERARLLEEQALFSDELQALPPVVTA